MEEELITEQVQTQYQQRYNELVKVIESFEKLDKTREWATLKELVFDKELISIDRQLLLASMEFPLDTAKLYKLQGERKQIMKYDIDSYIKTLKKQLADIKLKI